MIITSQSSNSNLSNFLRRLALAPNGRSVNELFNRFQEQFPLGFSFADRKSDFEETRRFLIAKKRLAQWEGLPDSLWKLMDRVQESIVRSLRVNPLLVTHMREITGGDLFEHSRFEDFMSAAALLGNPVSYSDLVILLGSDWSVKQGDGIHGVSLDFGHAMKTFHNLVIHAETLNVGTQLETWRSFGLIDYFNKLQNDLNGAKENKISPPTIATLNLIKQTGNTKYIPVGNFAYETFHLNLIAIDYKDNKYYLRLLCADNSPILALGDKEEHYCPEVIWEGVTEEQLLSPSLWEPLLEAATLERNEVTSLRDHRIDFDFLAFNSTHLVPWLIQHLGIRPHSRLIKVENSTWEQLRDNQYKSTHYVIDPSASPFCSNHHGTDLMLYPTGKEVKITRMQITTRKFVNLMPMDLFKSKTTLELFKAESRLLLIVAGFKTLQQGALPPGIRGHFVRLMEECFGKVTSPIERLMKLNPTEGEKKVANTLLTTLLDLKQQLTAFIQSADSISLATLSPLYPSTHSFKKLNLSEIHWSPIKPVVFDIIRLNDNVEAVPYHNVWRSENWPILYKSLAEWYDLLLDAKNKCEPAEIIMMAHRNVFSRLPIPTSEHVEETFPDIIPEGLLVGTLLILKKIASLVAAESYQDEFITPIFIADMTRSYRFAFELYRYLNPAVKELPVSWYALNRYIESRHSNQVPREIDETLRLLAASFKQISPLGHLNHLERDEIPLFIQLGRRFL